jgi:hypothetical protein
VSDVAHRPIVLFRRGWSGLMDVRSGLVKIAKSNQTGVVLKNVNVKP